MGSQIFALVLYRKQNKLTQAQLAEKLGVSQATVGSWEIGERRPNIITLKRLSKILNCTTDELLSTIKV